MTRYPELLGYSLNVQWKGGMDGVGCHCDLPPAPTPAALLAELCPMASHKSFRMVFLSHLVEMQKLGVWGGEWREKGTKTGCRVLIWGGGLSKTS